MEQIEIIASEGLTLWGQNEGVDHIEKKAMRRMLFTDGFLIGKAG